MLVNAFRLGNMIQYRYYNYILILNPEFRAL